MGATGARAFLILLVVVAPALVQRAALGSDQLIPCKTLSVKLNPNDPTRAAVKFTCKAAGSALALPDPQHAPTTNGFGASLLARDLVSNLYVVPGLVLPSAGWSASGNPPGAKGYRYHSKDTVGCRSVVVTPKQVKAKCSTSVTAGTLPAVGDVAISLTFQSPVPSPADRYCAQFGGTVLRNDDRALRRKDAPAPADCLTLSPSGAFVDAPDLAPRS
jgi:hypothetical protein